MHFLYTLRFDDQQGSEQGLHYSKDPFSKALQIVLFTIVDTKIGKDRVLSTILGTIIGKGRVLSTIVGTVIGKGPALSTIVGTNIGKGLA